MLHSRYVRGAIIGVGAAALTICTVYVALVITGTMDFSGVAFGAAAVLSAPGGAVLGLLIASDADPADDDDVVPTEPAAPAARTAEDPDLVRTLVRSDDGPEGVDATPFGRRRPGPRRPATDDPPSPSSAAPSVASVAGVRRRTRP